MTPPTTICEVCEQAPATVRCEATDASPASVRCSPCAQGTCGATSPLAEQARVRTSDDDWNGYRPTPVDDF